MHESSHQQLAGLQKEATSSLPAIRPAKGCCRKAANLLLLLQDTRQTHSRPAIRRGVCWTLCRSLLAERRGLELLFSELPDPTEHSYLQPRCTSPPARCRPAEEPWPQHPDKEHPRYAGCEVQSCSTSSASAGSLGNSVGALPSPYLQLCSGSPQILPLPRAPGSCHQPSCLCSLTSPTGCWLLSPGQTGAKLQGTTHGHAHLLSSTRGNSAEPWPATQRKGQCSPAAVTSSSAAVQPPFRSATNCVPGPTTCRLQRLVADALEAAWGHTHTGHLSSPLPPRLRDALPSLTLHPDPRT